jgi:hypothetical protein
MIGRQKIMINECIKYELNIYNRVKMYVFVSSTHSSNAFFFASFALVFTYEVWLWSSQNYFIANISVYLQLTERGHLQSTPLEQLCTYPNELPLLETFLDLQLSYSFQCCRQILLDVFNVLKSSSLLRHYLFFWKEPDVIRSQVRGMGWVFHLTYRFLVQKLLDSVLWAGALSLWRIKLLGQSSGPFIRTPAYNRLIVST